jgi:hypothetical protein
MELGKNIFDSVLQLEDFGRSTPLFSIAFVALRLSFSLASVERSRFDCFLSTLNFSPIRLAVVLQEFSSDVRAGVDAGGASPFSRFANGHGLV